MSHGRDFFFLDSGIISYVLPHFIIIHRPYIITFTSAICPRARVALSHTWVRICITCCNSSTSYIPPELARLSGLYLFVKPFYPIAGYPFNGDGMNPTCRFHIGCTFTMHVFHSITKVVNLSNDTN